MLLQSGIRSTSSIRLLMVYDHHQKRTSPHVLHSLLQAQSSHLTAYVNGGFPQIRGTLFWGPYNKDPTMWDTILGCSGWLGKQARCVLFVFSLALTTTRGA